MIILMHRVSTLLALLALGCVGCSNDDSAATDDTSTDDTSTDDASDDDLPGPGRTDDSTDDDPSSEPGDGMTDDEPGVAPQPTSPAPSSMPKPSDPDPSGSPSSSGALDACGNAPGQLFPPDAPWNTPIDDAPLDEESDAIIDYLQSNHDTGTRFQIDFSFRVLHADGSVDHREFTPNGDFYDGECDPAAVPVPEGGALEGEDGYACESDGDCHLIVIDDDECRLFEMWRADIRGDEFMGGCQAIWELDRLYGPQGRGDFCTSADAAGLPITPLLFDADEVYDGEIRHALRFILPNSHIRDSIYVRPGTHSTGATSGPDTAPPYAARLRLKASADISGLSRGGQVVAEALMRYGMFLADGGNLTFTGRSDRDTTHSWQDAALTPQDLKGLQWDDFEVVELGERIEYGSGDCDHVPVTE